MVNMSGEKISTPRCTNRSCFTTNCLKKFGFHLCRTRILPFDGLISKFWSELICNLDVWDLWRLWAEARWLAGDGEEGGDAQGHPARHVLHVHPEADPGHDDDEDGGDVGLDQVEANTAMSLKLGCQTAVVPWEQQIIINQSERTNQHNPTFMCKPSVQR